MQPYQQEYIENLRQIAALTQLPRPDGLGFEQYAALLRQNEALYQQYVRTGMALLRSHLFPLLDNLFEADEEKIAELAEFSFQLYDGRVELDVGLFCQIHQALLSLARQRRDRSATIRELYWLGMGRNSQCSKLIGLDLPAVEKYMIQMRLCFTEAAAYLKYYDEIEDTETRGYILRSRANIALGQFKTPGEKVALVRKTLEILSDKGYQEKEPGLPWERYIYMTHQHMASSISYSREKVMSPEDTAAIMESVYIVYQRRIQEAEAEQKLPSVRWAFPCYSIEFYCGLSSLDRLLAKIEDLIDAADNSDFSADGMYGAMSMPAFYCQFLQQYPEKQPPRFQYLENLYQKVNAYIDAFPDPVGNIAFFRCLQQQAYTYIEVPGGIPYGEFLLKVLRRFAPGIFHHSWSVAAAAAAFCGLIIDEEPAFFDDIDFIHWIADPAEKKRQVLEYAFGCGLFHDAGKLNFIELYVKNARLWFEDEYERARLHTIAGYTMLSERPSTNRYAAAALGHHAWYDGSVGIHGYPANYKRLSCPYRQMVDVIGLMDWLESVTHSAQTFTGAQMTFDEAIGNAISLEGKRFSPLLTARLRDSAITEKIRAAFADGLRQACRSMYNDAQTLRWAAGEPSL